MIRSTPQSNSPTEREIYNLFGIYRRSNFAAYDRDFSRLIRGVKLATSNSDMSTSIGGLEGTVLDLGCGFGSDFMLWLREREEFIGKMIHMDINPAVFAAEYKHSDLQYLRFGDTNICGNAENIPLEDSSVALVHQQGLFADLEDLIDSDLVFKEVYRILQPNGLYVINDTIPPPNNYFVKLAGDFRYPQGAYRRIALVKE